MVQSFNLPGLTSAFRLFTQPHFFVPHVVINDIRSIDFIKLKSLGIRALAFDKDNTLTAPYKTEIWPPFEAAWKECKDTFGYENIVIISNSAGTLDDPNGEQAKKLEESLGVPVLRHKEKKPAGGSALLEHFPSHPVYTIAVIGDRLMTDVLFGNQIGTMTLLTRAIVDEKGDNPVANRLRKMEHSLLDWLIGRGIQPPQRKLNVNLKDAVRE